MFDEDFDYAVSRWQGTYLLSKNGFILSGDSFKKGKTFLESIVIGVNEKGKPVHEEFKNISYSIPHIGYINPMFSQEAVYIQRTALRKDWKQGFRPSQYSMVKPNGHSVIGSGFFQTNLVSIRDSLFNKYPKFNDCLILLEEYYDTIAFSKSFAINNNAQLLYKGKICGAVDFKGRIFLNEKNKFVKEELLISGVSNDQIFN